jgi:hypothetical protein
MDKDYELLFKVACLKLGYFIHLKKDLFHVEGYGNSTLMPMEDFSNLAFMGMFSKDIAARAIFDSVRSKDLDLYYSLKCECCKTELLYKDNEDLSFYKNSIVNSSFTCLECEAEQNFKIKWNDLRKYICLTQDRLGSESQSDVLFCDIMREERYIERVLRWLRLV